MTGNANTPRRVIFNGDCIDVMRFFDRGTVDFILTDPPYVTNFRDRQGRTVANDDNGRWLRPAFNQSYRSIAEILLGFRGTKEDFESDPRKNKARRLVSHGIKMMRGGYRLLLHYPVKSSKF